MNKKLKFSLFKLSVFLLLLLPALFLIYGLINNSLGTNPVEKLTHETGTWSLICLILSLAVTPLKNIFGWKWLMKFRRMLGLYAFFYAFLHFSVYWVFDQSLSFEFLWEDIKERPYITMGFSALLLMLPLAITSTQGWRKRLAKKWISLHKLAYPAAILALLHYIWLIRADYQEVVIYAVLIIALLAYRAVRAMKKAVQ